MGARRQGFIAVLFVAAMVMPPAMTFAQTQQERDWCSNKGNPTPDQQISSCTALIQSGRYDPFKASLAVVFFDRAHAFSKKGQDDHAIEDYDQAIRLNPQYAAAFYNRGLARQRKGDTAAGDADIAKARQLQPGIGQ